MRKKSNLSLNRCKKHRGQEAKNQKLETKNQKFGIADRQANEQAVVTNEETRGRDSQTCDVDFQPPIKKRPFLVQENDKQSEEKSVCGGKTKNKPPPKHTANNQLKPPSSKVRRSSTSEGLTSSLSSGVQNALRNVLLEKDIGTTPKEKHEWRVKKKAILNSTVSSYGPGRLVRLVAQSSETGHGTNSLKKKRMDRATVVNKMEALISELQSDGYESMMIVAQVEDSVLIQHGSTQGKLFFNDRAPKFFDFLPFCIDASKQKQSESSKLAQPEMKQQVDISSADNDEDDVDDANIDVNVDMVDDFNDDDDDNDDDVNRDINNVVDRLLENNDTEKSPTVSSEKVKLTVEMENRTDLHDHVATYIEGTKPRHITKMVGNFACLVDQSEDRLWNRYISKEKTKLIDYLRKDLNNESSAELDKTEIDTDINKDPSQENTNSTSSDKGIAGYAQKVVQLYDKMDHTMNVGGVNICNFCGLMVKGVKNLQAHVNGHRQRLEVPLESCQFCGLILPEGYLRFHPCGKKELGLPPKISVWFDDLRDHITYMEMELQQKEKREDLFCHVCNEKLNTSTYLIHFLHNHIQTFTCACLEVCFSYNSVNAHLQGIQCKDTGPFKQCLLCNLPFEDQQQLFDHLEDVHRKSGEFMCEKCDMCFSCEYTLKDHVCSDVSAKYTCKIEDCRAWFSEHREFLTHKHKVHGVPSYPCNVCGKEFLVSSGLTNHQEWVHGIGNPKECQICHKVFRGPRVLRSHMSVHKDILYSCASCGMVYKTRTSLFHHCQREHPVVELVKKPKKVHKCETCGNTFSKKARLNHHIVVSNHVTEKQIFPANCSQCPLCGKRFGYASLLKKHHNQVHEKVMSYMCHYCSKTFTDSSNLRVHVQTHTGDRPKCDICDKVFRSKRKEEEHMQTVHGMEAKDMAKTTSEISDKGANDPNPNTVNACSMAPGTDKETEVATDNILSTPVMPTYSTIVPDTGFLSSQSPYYASRLPTNNYQ